MSTKNKAEQPLVSLRSAVVLLIGTQAAMVTGFLTHMAGNPMAASALAGISAFGAAVAFARSAIR